MPRSVNIRVAGIFMEDDRLLFLKMRKKDGMEYFVLPGGRIEGSESIEQGLKRELKEELGVDVTGFHLTHIREIEINKLRGIELYFNITKYSGKITAGYDPEPDKESVIQGVQFVILDNIDKEKNTHPKELIDLIKKYRESINPERVIYLGFVKL